MQLLQKMGANNITFVHFTLFKYWTLFANVLPTVIYCDPFHSNIFLFEAWLVPRLRLSGSNVFPLFVFLLFVCFGSSHFPLCPQTHAGFNSFILSCSQLSFNSGVHFLTTVILFCWFSSVHQWSIVHFSRQVWFSSVFSPSCFCKFAASSAFLLLFFCSSSLSLQTFLGPTLSWSWDYCCPLLLLLLWKLSFHNFKL